MSDVLSGLGFAPPGTSTQVGQSVQPIQGLTPAAPVVETGVTKYYWNTVKSASMHCPDGLRIIFVDGFYETSLEAPQVYLDSEIKKGHPNVRAATDEEIQAHKLKTNPIGTIRSQLRAEIEAEVRKDLEAQIRAEMGNRGFDPSVPADDASLTEASTADLEQVTDENKLRGTTTAADTLARLKEGTRSGSGTILQPSAPAALSSTLQQSSISGTDKISDMSAGSVGSSTSSPSN